MKNKLKLVLPNKKYASSCLKMEKEFQKEKIVIAASGMDLFNSMKDFPIYNKRMRDNRKGINLAKGWVPSTLYWAIVGKKVVGRLSLRHFLNKKLATVGGHIGYGVSPSERRKGYATEMLRLGLKQSWKLGIKKALITCDEDNVGSRKVIEKNGGVFAGKHKSKEGVKLRYWIYKNER